MGHGKVRVTTVCPLPQYHSGQAEELLAALVARTHELPADRCVLDPDGEGGLRMCDFW